MIVDCHLDLAWNALGYKRDLTLPLAELNRGEQGLADHAGRGLATTTLPEMRAGGVGLCLATLIARTPVGATAIHGNLLDYPTPAAAAAVAAGQLAWYRALAEAGEVALLGSAARCAPTPSAGGAATSAAWGSCWRWRAAIRSSHPLTCRAGMMPVCA